MLWDSNKWGGSLNENAPHRLIESGIVLLEVYLSWSSYVFVEQSVMLGVCLEEARPGVTSPAPGLIACCYASCHDKNGLHL